MIVRADARQIPLRDGCVQCVVTSPPYWGLRDYGDPNQIGLELSPQAYVDSLVAVFREARRVLKDDGTVWLNLGDTYNNFRVSQRGNTVHDFKVMGRFTGRRKVDEALKEKDLVGIPWRIAFALQADGWYLRSDIIWAKPNPMPESVTDRPTKSHEYVFLLTKSERYFYDAEAISEPISDASSKRYEQGYNGSWKRARLALPTDARTDGHQAIPVGQRRNKRSVWTVPTEPYDGAHFATFPEALVEPCILAGSRPGDLVFDPFLGSGTVGAVAERLDRRWVGTDLSYHDLSTERTAQHSLRF